MLGHEEETIIQPAIEALRDEGFNVFGPVSPDALFTPRARASYDLALCMYHDQGLIPLKALHIDEGVNISLGLPIIRTAPDHGTAFDIAGQGVADPGAMIAAIAMAGEAAEHRAREAV
jgi:4-hydroxythreonine-4-phosphate dehydrogenase